MTEKQEANLKKFNYPEEIQKRIEFLSNFDPITNPKGMVVDIGYGKVKVECKGFPWLVQVKKKKRGKYQYKNYFVRSVLNIGKMDEFQLSDSYFILTSTQYSDLNEDKYLLVGIDKFYKEFKIIHTNVKIMIPGLDNTIGYSLPEEK